MPKGHEIRPELCEYPGVPMRLVPLAEIVRGRLNDLIDRIGISHEALAPHLGVSASAVSKLLSGTNAIGLDHIDGFCVALQVTPAEVIADPTSLIQPVTPIEAALLAHFRQMTELERRSLLTILERPIYAAPDKKARLGRAMLSAKEQELVDLFGRVKKDGVRDGVLKTLRGAAEIAAPDHPKPRTTG